MGIRAEAIPTRPTHLYEEYSPTQPTNIHPPIPASYTQLEHAIRNIDPSHQRQRARHAPDDQALQERLARDNFHGVYLEVGSRIRNGVHFSLQEQTAYGQLHQEAREHEDLRDHGHEHERRVMKWIRELVINSPELHLESPRILYALALFEDHDADQLDTEHRNLTRKDKLDPKLGHGLAGGLRMLALAEKQAKEAHITYTSALDNAMIAGAMVYLHDNPDQLDKALLQTERTDGRKAFEILPNGNHRILRGEELINAYEQGVDLLSLRPSQVVELTRWKKSTDKKGRQSGYITDTTPHGLHPAFEEEFMRELAALESGEYADRLLFDGQEASAQLRQEFTVATRIAQFADQLDMVIPFREALMRKFWVPIAQNRAYFQPNIADRVLKQTGNLPSESDSDAGRGLWEVHTLSQRIQGLPGQQSQSLVESSYISQLVGKLQVAGILEQKRAGTIIMSGDQDAIANMIEDTFTTQLLLIGDKMLRRADVLNVSNIQTPPILIEDAIQALTITGNTEYADRLAELRDKNEHAIAHTLQCLKAKPGGIHTYSADDIRAFRDFCDQLLMTDHGLTHEQIAQLERDVRGKATLELPYTTYYSLGEEGAARTFTRRARRTQAA